LPSAAQVWVPLPPPAQVQDRVSPDLQVASSPQPQSNTPARKIAVQAYLLRITHLHNASIIAARFPYRNDYQAIRRR
jgi:hypothetical protein